MYILTAVMIGLSILSSYFTVAAYSITAIMVFLALSWQIYIFLLMTGLVRVKAEAINEQDLKTKQKNLFSTISNCFGFFAILINTPYMFIVYLIAPFVLSNVLVQCHIWLYHFLVSNDS